MESHTGQKHTKVVENNFVGREIILSFEMIFDGPEIFLTIEKTFSSVEK